jgi:short subunit dehydrogenase-like uncharacterized protein
MGNRILLYGATGYTGRLIASEAARRLRSGQGYDELTLASRDQRALKELASSLQLPWKAFALDERPPVMAALEGFDVLLNAAGPFSSTASRLAKAALDSKCHYVDLDSEPDVHNALDDLDPIASRRGLAVVCGAGWITTASDVLLDHALANLSVPAPNEALSTLRIAFSPSPFVSRGSAITTVHAIREEVGVLRNGKLTHIPIGRLERTFDFATGGTQRLGIASACNVADTTTAKLTVARHDLRIPDIESYVELSAPLRLAYEVGALGAVAMHLPFAQRLATGLISMLPEGPREDERQRLRNTVAIEIESSWREIVASWVLETTNLYDFSACSALDIASKLSAQEKVNPALKGWVTPSAVLSHAGPNPLSTTPFTSPFLGSVLCNHLEEVAR